MQSRRGGPLILRPHSSSQKPGFGCAQDTARACVLGTSLLSLPRPVYQSPQSTPSVEHQVWKEEWNRERTRAPSAAATHTRCCQNVCAAPHSRHPWHLCRAVQTLAQVLAKSQACTFWGQFTNLVGKEQIAHSVVVWVLHDSSDHLQHWGDACKTGPTYTEWVPAGAHQTPRPGLRPPSYHTPPPTPTS